MSARYNSMPSILSASTARYFATSAATIEGLTRSIISAIRSASDKGFMECEVKIPNIGTQGLTTIYGMFANADYKIEQVTPTNDVATIRLNWAESAPISPFWAEGGDEK